MFYFFLNKVYSDEISPSGIPSSEFPSIINKLFNENVGKNLIGGSVIISKNGNKIFETSQGYADYYSKSPVTNESLFEWGSITKFWHIYQ